MISPAILAFDSAPPQQRDGTTWVVYRNYASWFRETKGERPIRRTTFLSHAARAKSYAWWNRADPKPFLASGMLAARRLAGRVLRRVGLR